MRKQAIERQTKRRTAASRLRGYSQSRESSFTKNDLQALLRVFGRGIDVRVSKPELVNAVLQLRQDITASSVDLDSGEDGQQTESSILAEASQMACKSLREASLSGWVMKPLVTTMGMRERSRNEIEVIKALPKFFERIKGAFAKQLGSLRYEFDRSIPLNMLHIRSTGLLESRKCRRLVDSPDALAAASNQDDVTIVFAMEIKTMTALTTIQAASNSAVKYGKFVFLSEVGADSRRTDLFGELVPTSAYRVQMLHHAAMIGLNSVLFVVGTGGSVTESRVVYACMVHFAEGIRHKYTYVLDCIRHTAFTWIGGGAGSVPEEYCDMLQTSYASDVYSFMPYYNLSQNATPRCRRAWITNSTGTYD